MIIEIRKISHYTTLPILLDILSRKKLVLVRPETWEDRNDAEVILNYQKRMKIPNLFAKCFATGSETVHHWKAYANGVSGCCVEFDHTSFRKTLQSIKGIRFGDVKYKKIYEAEGKAISPEDIPFTKRFAFRCEQEFRVLWEGKTDRDCFEIGIDLAVIRKITLSQNMPHTVVNVVKDLCQKVAGRDIDINHSTLYLSNRWIRALGKNNI